MLINIIMTTLIPSGAIQLFQKISLFYSYDPIQYQEDSQYSWISAETLREYHDACHEILLERYDEVATMLSSIDKNSSNSMQLASEKINEDTFVMLPEDVSTYMDNGLSFEATVEDDMFGELVATSAVFSTSDSGNTIQLTFNASSINTGIHPFPYTSIDATIVFELSFWQNNYYRNGTSPSTIIINDMYRGPADNIGDRGQNYYAPLTITCSSLDGMTANNYFRNVSGTWRFDTQSFELTGTFDNGATATFLLYVPMTISAAVNKLSGSYTLNANESSIDFQGSITQPKYQWSEFTTTQSPNILRAIDALSSEAEVPQTDLYISAIVDSISDVWSGLIDALPNGENISVEDVVAYVENRLLRDKAIAASEDVAAIKKSAKTHLANSVFVEVALYALSELGIDYDVTMGMTTSELSDLNDLLIDQGVADFEEADGYYNWANIPGCNSMDVSAQFSTAVFNQINDFSVMLEHPALSWISSNFDYIEAEIINVKSELDKVI